MYPEKISPETDPNGAQSKVSYTVSPTVTITAGVLCPSQIVAVVLPKPTAGGVVTVAIT